MAKKAALTDLREDMQRFLAKVEVGKQRFVLTSYRKERAALVPVEDLRRLEALDKKQKKKPK